MSKHTPGPWHIGMKPGPMIYGMEGEQIADMRTLLIPSTEHSANARLISAAPDMLAALQRIMSEADGGWFNDSPTAKIAAAAISKATGE